MWWVLRSNEDNDIGRAYKICGSEWIGRHSKIECENIYKEVER